MAAKTHLFNCLSDNFGVLIHDPQTGATASIDAPEAAAVEKALKDTGWTLTDILVTHHHNDHTAGVAELKQKHKCRVIGPEAATSSRMSTKPSAKAAVVKVGNLAARVLETPGHTLDHICYIFDSEKIAFVADTLFSVGCGRVIEGTMPQMWHSLLKLRALPDDMVFHCGHEYTQANIKFALTIEPDNADLKAAPRKPMRCARPANRHCPPPSARKRKPIASCARMFPRSRPLSGSQARTPRRSLRRSVSAKTSFDPAPWLMGRSRRRT